MNERSNGHRGATRCRCGRTDATRQTDTACHGTLQAHAPCVCVGQSGSHKAIRRDTTRARGQREASCVRSAGYVLCNRSRQTADDTSNVSMFACVPFRVRFGRVFYAVRTRLGVYRRKSTCLLYSKLTALDRTPAATAVPTMVRASCSRCQMSINWDLGYYCACAIHPITS